MPRRVAHPKAAPNTQWKATTFSETREVRASKNAARENSCVIGNFVWQQARIEGGVHFRYNGRLAAPPKKGQSEKPTQKTHTAPASLLSFASLKRSLCRQCVFSVSVFAFLLCTRVRCRLLQHETLVEKKSVLDCRRISRNFSPNKRSNEHKSPNTMHPGASERTKMFRTTKNKKTIQHLIITLLKG